MRRRPALQKTPPSAPLDERKTEALVVAMALAPGVYVRNRMFDFYARTGAQKARARASSLRGIVAQLARATTLSITLDGAPHSPTGEPTFWATLGDFARFTRPTLIGVRPFAYVGAPAAEARYNGAHNAPFVAADRHGGFIAIGLGMNANGYAQNQNGTGYGYVVSGVEAGGTRWRTPALATLR